MGARFRNGGPLGAFDGVVRAQVDVRSIRGEFDFVEPRQTRELFRFRRGGDVVGKPFFQFTDGFGGPSAGVQHIHGLSRKAKIHGRHAELQAATALDKDDRVVVGYGKKAAEFLFGGGVDAFVFRRAVAHLHDGHAPTAPVKQFFADALENRQG